MKELFQSFVKPRWKRGDAKNRRQAVKELSADDMDILQEIILTDEDESVRLTACKKVSDLDQLRNIIDQTSCDAVKTELQDKIKKQLKANVLEAGDNWQTALEHVSNDTCLAEIVLESGNIELRQCAADKISGQDALMTVVTGACGKEVGLAVLERISGEEFLEIIAHDGGNKAVRHEAAGRLDALRKPDEPIEEEPQVDVEAELKALVDYAESIKKTYNFDGVAKVLDQKKEAWRELDPNLESQQFPQFQSLIQMFEERRNEFEEKQAEQARQLAEQQALSEKKAVIIETLSTLSPRDEGVAETLSGLNEEWRGLDDLDSEDENEAMQRAFTRNADELEKSLKTLAQETEERATLEARCTSLEAVLEEGNEKAFHANRKQTWKQPSWTFNDPEPLKQRFNKAVKAINEKLDSTAKEREANKQQMLDELNGIVPAIKEAIDAGNRKKATDKVKALQARWQELDGWSHAALAKEYKIVLDAFWDKQRESREEQDWQEWANKGIKEKLIDAVEATASMEDLKKVAKLIREAQKKWKATGPVPHKDNEPMWQRFHEACESNYARCKEFFDEKDKERQENLETCTKLCEEAETLKESENWRSAVGRYKAMQREWKAHGSLPRKQADELYNRFRTACDEFFARFGEHMEDVDSHRDDNQAAKEELVKKAEALVAEESHNVGACIQLQKKWKELGPGLKAKDQEIWTAFRTACDAFFTKLEEEHTKNVPAKEAICEKLEALVAEISDDTDRKALADKIVAAQNEWRALGPLPKAYEGDVGKRFRKACNAFFGQRREEFAGIEDERERNLAIKRDMIAQAENLAESDDWKETADELKQLQAEWKVVGHVPREHDKDVWQAFRRACDVFFSRRKEHFDKMDHRRQENLYEKEELLASLENIVGVKHKESEDGSPEPDSTLDLADQLQVAFATNFAMGGGSGSDRDEVRRIQERWKEVGPIPREKNDELWKRYKSLLDKFYGDK